MKNEKKHAGLKEEKRQAKATGSGSLGTADSNIIKKRSEQVTRQYKKNREKKIQQKIKWYWNVSKPYSNRELAVLFLGFLGFLGFSIVLLTSESTLHATMSEVNTKKSKYENLVTQNDILESEIDSEMDIEMIFKIATENLGMTYPKKNQVIVYQRLESEHVEQNEDIPKK